MPYHEAFYLSAPDKIYAVMENYIAKCNATTGAREAVAKVCSPCYGPMRITGTGSTLYVAAVNDYTLNAFDPIDSAVSPTTSKQIWTVDANTLAATNTLSIDDLWQTNFAGSPDPAYSCTYGPRAMKISGGYIYAVYTRGDGSAAIIRVNLANPLDNFVVDFNYFNIFSSDQYYEQFDINGTDVFWPWPVNQEIGWSAINVVPPGTNPYTLVHAPTTAPYFPTACVFVASNNCVYAVSGTDVMHKYDTIGNSISTVNLGTVLTNGFPNRIRLSPLDGKLYIPSQFDDSIIVWTPGAETGIHKTGFDSPIDVVFTNAKTFAVQTAPTGLKEVL